MGIGSEHTIFCCKNGFGLCPGLRYELANGRGQNPSSSQLSNIYEPDRVTIVDPNSSLSLKSSSLDNSSYINDRSRKSYTHKQIPQKHWSFRQKRLYHRTMSGLELAKEMGESIRFMTLTSSPDSTDINHGFRCLVKRIRRKYGKFEYIAAREYTQSGLIHIHLLYRGSYIPQRWLSNAWKRLNNARIVDIRLIDMQRRKKSQIGAYMVKYLTKQMVGKRSWWSWGWVFRGFVKIWKGICYFYRSHAIKVWHTYLKCLSNGLIAIAPHFKDPPPNSLQTRFDIGLISKKIDISALFDYAKGEKEVEKGTEFPKMYHKDAERC